MQPRVFIGSSSEGLLVAQELQNYLENENNYPPHESQVGPAKICLWTEEPIFELGGSLQKSLIRATQDFDFAIMIFSGEDTVIARNIESPSPRDNVVFEAGLFAGALGFDRLFIVTPRGVHIRIPSDLAGFNHTTYLKREDGSLNVSVAGKAVLGAIDKLGVTRHDDIEPKIRTLVSRARSAYNIDHSLFHEYLGSWCDSSLEVSDLWPRGSMVAENQSGQWLATVFRQAKLSIFSTSIPSYMPWWRKSVGKQLLRAQVAAACPSTRVFVFPNEGSISPEDKAVMAEHRDAGVRVHTFYSDDISEFTWNPGKIDTDFAFIDDGEIVIVTEQAKGSYRARWFFKHRDKKKEYSAYRESLLTFSEPF